MGLSYSAVTAQGGVLLITADHGNAERMVDDKGGPHTAHTTNPVRLVFVDEARATDGGSETVSLEDGKLGDIAPTLLALLNLPQPPEMTGQNLLQAR